MPNEHRPDRRRRPPVRADRVGVGHRRGVRWVAAMSDIDHFPGLDVVELFEVKAEAFRIMTGYTAPGKSESAIGYSGHSYDERYDAWTRWNDQYSGCVRAVLGARRRIMRSVEE